MTHASPLAIARRGNRVKQALLVSFLLLTALVLLATGLGAFGIQRIDSTHQNIARNMVPLMTEAQHLSVEVARLAAVAPRLNAATTERERHVGVMELNQGAAQIVNILARLKQYSLDSANLIGVQREIDTLLETLAELNRLVRQRTTLRQQIDDALRDALAAQWQLRDQIEPLLLTSFTPPPAISSLIDQDRMQDILIAADDRNRAYYDLLLGASRVVSHMGLAQSATDIDTVRSNMLQAQQGGDLMFNTLSLLQDQELRQRVGPLVAQLVSITRMDDLRSKTLLNFRAEELATQQRLTVLAAENWLRTIKMIETVDHLVAETRTGMTALGERTSESARRGLLLMAGMALLGAGLACVIGVVFLRRVVVHSFDDLRDQAETLSRARAQADAANLAKSQFLANMSHELRTPLNAIIGITELLQEEDETVEPAERREGLRRVTRAGRHLLTLINDVLDLSKVEAGKLELMVEPINIVPLLQEAVGTLEAQAASQLSNIILDYTDPLAPVLADSMRVKQIVLNLLSNAVKFTRQGRITITANRQGGMVRICVADTGIGIRADQMDKLFQDFTQADSGIGRRFGGTGLGLAISRRFARMMGGDIVATSAPGKGSEFTLVLPIAQQKEGEPRTDSPSSAKADPASLSTPCDPL